MRVAIIIFCLLTLTLSSCTNIITRQPSATATRSAFTPMRYDQWQFQTFTNVSLCIDLPVGVRAEEVFDGKIWILSMGFHYRSQPFGVLDDATVFVHIYVNRITLEQFAEQKASYRRSELYKQGKEEDHQYWNWYYDLHPETSRRDDTGWYDYYQRDVILNEKEILNVRAEVLKGGPKESQDADHAAVKRILDSIVQLNTATNAVSNVTTNK